MKRMILYNGKVYLEREKFAEAVLVEDDRIGAVGTNEEILAQKTADTELLDLEGKTVIPGLNDSHAHVLFLGEYLNSVQLLGVESIEEVIQRGKEFLATHTLLPGQVLTGQGWNQEQFPENERRFLDRHDLDRISTEIPIIFNRTCGHVVSCNTKALEVAGYTADTPQPEGGSFEIGEDGKPNGIFKELADRQLKKIIPTPTIESIKQEIMLGARHMISLGITSVQSMNIKEHEEQKSIFPAILQLRDQGKFPMRMCEQNYFTDPEYLEAYLESDFYKNLKHDNIYKQGTIKTFLDGSLGGRTALMKRDYADAPGERGLHAVSKADFERIVQIAHAHHLQVLVHAIGDEAIEIALDTFDRVNQHGPNVNRHGILHCQITDYSMLKRFKETDTLAVVQPVFLNSDWSIVDKRVGVDLAKTSYAFKTMLDLGVHVALGTDCPTEDINPFECIYCAVTRKDLKGRPEGGYHPEECLDIYEAIDGYTQGSAYVSFEENEKGRIQKGYYADLAVLDQDIFTVPKDKIKDIHADLTMVGGNIVFRRES